MSGYDLKLEMLNCIIQNKLLIRWTTERHVDSLKQARLATVKTFVL